MNTDAEPIPTAHFSHDLLLHHRDDDFVDGARAFINQGLGAGGEVVVNGPQDQVATLRESLGDHKRLVYAPDGERCRCSLGALFATQLRLAQDPPRAGLWAVQVMFPGGGAEAVPRWTRRHSLANEVLDGYAFHALCTCDTRTAPAAVVAASLATHPHVSHGGGHVANPHYQPPADFQSHPLAARPVPPDSEPSLVTSLHSLRDVGRARFLVMRLARHSSLESATRSGFATALHEVLVNALQHGAPPVQLRLWVEPSRLTGEVVDAGPGVPDLLAGCRYPLPSGPLGLWVARQTCDDVLIQNLPEGGCRVLLATG